MNLSLMPLENDDLFRVRCTGPITLRGSDPNADPLAALLGPHCFSHKILVNLGGAESIDTSGVAWLTRLRGAFQEGGGMLVLSQVPPIVSGLLDFLRVTPLFCIAADDAEGRVRALAASPARDRNHRVLPFQAAV
jgi:anti-anti-sigma regulatory factor